MANALERDTRMALTTELILDFLVQQTSDYSCPLIWHETSGGAYRAVLNDITVELCEVAARTGSHWCLTFTTAADKVFVQEPLSTSLFGRSYRDETERAVAEALRELSVLVGQQCESRRRRAWDQREEIKQQIFRKLLFGGDPNAT